ncbi:Hfq-related RNA-binding protein [Aphanothece sacrum]|uniref:Hfq-related domain-containing protein n=1 Tax=Aphanothece sacrum FPU1 TaxID=1920663 RepID=A0A401IJG9_APHSA|nr:RNA-binding protein hfq [Aphanothece sacrum]GBF81442.1 hypothetical protein AsFPU1_2855 [Aphanothece sacrum FPU1]GBF85573.1 hypothetical protein AsFPU3_2635 [Aphanothece sacrum FPU3]
MAEFDTGLPSIRQVQRFIKDKTKVNIKLTTQELLTGTILWQDVQCLCLSDEANQTILVWRQALVYLKPNT